MREFTFFVCLFFALVYPQPELNITLNMEVGNIVESEISTRNPLVLPLGVGFLMLRGRRKNPLFVYLFFPFLILCVLRPGQSYSYSSGDDGAHSSKFMILKTKCKF